MIVFRCEVKDLFMYEGINVLAKLNNKLCKEDVMCQGITHYPLSNEVCQQKQP